MDSKQAPWRTTLAVSMRCVRDVREDATYPWLRGVVADVPDLHAGLFPELALDRVFERLAGLDEAGHTGPEPCGPL